MVVGGSFPIFWELFFFLRNDTLLFFFSLDGYRDIPWKWMAYFLGVMCYVFSSGFNLSSGSRANLWIFLGLGENGRYYVEWKVLLNFFFLFHYKLVTGRIRSFVFWIGCLKGS